MYIAWASFRNDNSFHFVSQDMAAFKIAGLQKALEESIPSSDLDQANKKYHELTEKYRDLLEKGNNLVLKAEMLTGLEVSLKFELGHNKTNNVVSEWILERCSVKIPLIL